MRKEDYIIVITRFLSLGYTISYFTGNSGGGIIFQDNFTVLIGANVGSKNRCVK